MLNIFKCARILKYDIISLYHTAISIVQAILISCLNNYNGYLIVYLHPSYLPFIQLYLHPAARWLENLTMLLDPGLPSLAPFSGFPLYLK